MNYYNKKTESYITMITFERKCVSTITNLKAQKQFSYFLQVLFGGGGSNSQWTHRLDGLKLFFLFFPFVMSILLHDSIQQTGI